MKICRFHSNNAATARYALLEGDLVRPLSSGFDVSSAGEAIPIADVTLLPPVAPSKVVCVGRNYREHAAELGNKMPNEPLLFLKAPSAIIGSRDCIRLPPESAQVEHEGELGVVIKKTACKLSDNDNPLDYILGYTCVNDVTARDLQRQDVQFTRAKSFDTFCPVGPHIETDLDPLNVIVTTSVNGAEKQRGNTRDMAFSVPFLVRYIAKMMTLYPGDLIVTGTPAGVSQLKAGDTVEVKIAEVGVLQNSVR